MPSDLPQACHNCTSLGYLFVEGAHAWCDRHRQVCANAATGCAYWYPAKNAATIPVPKFETMLSVDLERIGT